MFALTNSSVVGETFCEKCVNIILFMVCLCSAVWFCLCGMTIQIMTPIGMERYIHSCRSTHHPFGVFTYSFLVQMGTDIADVRRQQSVVIYASSLTSAWCVTSFKKGNCIFTDQCFKKCDHTFTLAVNRSPEVVSYSIHLRLVLLNFMHSDVMWRHQCIINFC